VKASLPTKSLRPRMSPAAARIRKHKSSADVRDPRARELCHERGSSTAALDPGVRACASTGGLRGCAAKALGGCWRWSRSERRRLIVEPSPPHLADTSATTCALQVPTPPLIWSTPPQPLTRKFQWERRRGGGAGERGGEVRWEK
jgi:hypothetical protein